MNHFGGRQSLHSDEFHFFAYHCHRCRKTDAKRISYSFTFHAQSDGKIAENSSTEPLGLPEGVHRYAEWRGWWIAKGILIQTCFFGNKFHLKNISTSPTASSPLSLREGNIKFMPFAVSVILSSLIVSSVNFKVALRMCTGGADFGCFGAGYQVTAVTAFPDFGFCLFKYLFGFHVL